MLRIDSSCFAHAIRQFASCESSSGSFLQAGYEMMCTLRPGSFVDPEVTTISKSTGLRRFAMVVKRWQVVTAVRLKRPESLEVILLGLALLVYLGVRLVRLEDYPIYFFSDEAAQTVLAADLVRDNFRGADDQFLPAYFLNSYQYNLSTSVYVQVLPSLLFGASVWLTRATAAVLSLVAALSVGLILRRIFRCGYAWTAVLLLSITPAWFLHSRTAFETSLATSFYAGMLYFYLRYRFGAPPSLYAAVIFGALSFYSYSPARVVVLVTAVLLFISDFHYHRAQRQTVLKGLGLALLMALPLVRFQMAHPEENLRHLQVLNSYWIQPISTGAKLARYADEYLKGLNPFYWYSPKTNGMARHVMTGYGHVLLATLPAAALGVAECLRRLRSPAHRAVLIALLAAPSGAAMVALGITRVLIMVVPLAVLSALGLSQALTWLENRWQKPRRALALPLFLVLALFNVHMLHDALVNGRFWSTDYGLGGMQYGAVQIFGEIQGYLERSPDTHIILSPSWANGTDTIARFFFLENLPFEIGSIVGFMQRMHPLDDKMLFIMTPEEYEQVLESNKFTGIRVEKVIPYPDGRAGFYFTRLRYVDGVETIFEAEREQRRTLLSEELVVAGSPARVSYSYSDLGSIKHLFDGDLNTLMRTFEANPLRVYITWLQSRPVNRVEVRIGGTATQVDLIFQDEKGIEILHTSQVVGEEPDPRTLTFTFVDTVETSRLLVLVTSIHSPEPAHVHLWEISVQ